MSCIICSLDAKLRADVEKCLSAHGGILSTSDKKDLSAKYPEQDKVIMGITDTDCKMHWNFHQADAHEPQHYENDDKDSKSSIAADTGKDEGEVLFDMLNKQAATFNMLTRRINEALEDKEKDLSSMIINPANAQLYLDTGESIRKTVESIRDLNIAVNGSKNGASEGLKALVGAIAAGVKAGNSVDQSTTEYND